LPTANEPTTSANAVGESPGREFASRSDPNLSH